MGRAWLPRGQHRREVRPQGGVPIPSQLVRLCSCRATASESCWKTAEPSLISLTVAWVGPLACQGMYCILAYDDQCPPKVQSSQEPVVSNLGVNLPAEMAAVSLPHCLPSKRQYVFLGSFITTESSECWGRT